MASILRRIPDIAFLPRIKLCDLKDLPGARKAERRKGRGPGSKRGKTCGRGHKGQGQRSRKPRIGFEGGQSSPFYLRIPKHGFYSKTAKDYKPLNLGQLQYLIERGRLDATKPITMYHIHKAGGFGTIKHGIKLLGNGSEWFTAKVDVEVSKASQSAIAAVERQGGKVVTAYYNELGLRVLLRPEKYDERLKPRRALPSKKDMPYYLSERNRGYLLTGSGQKRLAKAGLAGCYVDEDGRVAVPGKPTTEGAPPAPTKEEYLEELAKAKRIVKTPVEAAAKAKHGDKWETAV